MMQTRIDYGKEGLAFEIPEAVDAHVVRPMFVEASADQIGLVRASLENPIATRRLRAIAKRGDSVGIVFSDITRATPYGAMLPPLLEEIHAAGVRPGDITFFCATGTHRPCSKSELEAILGQAIASQYRVVQNDCTDTSSHRVVGTTRSGNQIEILREFLDCNLRVLTGFIEPHFFAGMSGGGKAVMPGLGSLASIQRNHSVSHIDNDQARWGITIGNPLWEEIQEAALLTEPTFILNVAMNRSKSITASFAGDFVEAHRVGCEHVRAAAMVPVPGQFDVVVTSNSGYPLDLNLYQCVKGMSAANQIVKQGGHIVMAGECWDGVPEHGEFRSLLAKAQTPSDLLRTIRTPGFLSPDMWQAQIHARVCERATVHFYSDYLSDEQMRDAFLEPCADIGALLRSLCDQADGALTLCVLPEGPLTIPHVEEKEATK